MPAFLAYFFGALAPFALRVALVGDALHATMAAMIGVYGAVLVVVARNTHRVIVESLRLRFENAAFVDRPGELPNARSALEDVVHAGERGADIPRSSSACGPAGRGSGCSSSPGMPRASACRALTGSRSPSSPNLSHPMPCARR